MTSFKSRLPVLTLITFQLFATRAAALPILIDTGQFTDRHAPTLPDPQIPAGDHLLIYAEIQSTDPPGSPTIAVSAKQGDTIVTLERRTQLPGEYLGFTNFDPNLAGAWDIVLTDSTGAAPSAFTNSLAEPELLPHVESITTQGSPRGASVEWTLPDLTGFDVDSMHVRIVQVTPRSSVFATFLPFPATSFEPPFGILQYGVEYAYGIGLIDDEGFYTENRSVAQSQPFRYALPGDFNLDGAVDAADLTQWQGDFGVNANSDADGDADADGADFLAWQRQLGAGSITASHAAVPEPTSAALVAIVVLGRLVAASTATRESPSA